MAGPLVEIEWRAETGTLFGHFRGVLLAELENFVFALLRHRAGLPDADPGPHPAPARRTGSRLRLPQQVRARVAGADRSPALQARAADGRRGAAVPWGEHDEFAFTLGGFHPSFRPFIPAGLREPARLGATWHPNEFVDLNLQSYFAITSTSLQYGGQRTSRSARAGAACVPTRTSTSW